MYKEKIESYAKEVESKQAEIALLKNQLSKKTAKLDSKQTEIAHMKEELNETSVNCELMLGSAVTTKFSKLLDKVTELRKIRKALPVAGDIFPCELQRKVDMFLNSQNTIHLSSMKQYQHILTTETDIREQQKLIAVCSDKDMLPSLIETRDKSMKKCIREIKSYVKHISLLPLDKREVELKEALKELNVDCEELLIHVQNLPPDSPMESALEVVVNTYELEKVDKSSALQKLQQAANEKSNNVFKAISHMQRECHCVVSEVTGCIDENIDLLIGEYETAINEELKSAKVMSVFINCYVYVLLSSVEEAVNSH